MDSIEIPAEQKSTGPSGEKFYRVSQTSLLGLVAILAGGGLAKTINLPERVEAVAEDVRELSQDVRELKNGMDASKVDIASLKAELNWVKSEVATMKQQREWQK